MLIVSRKYESLNSILESEIVSEGSFEKSDFGNHNYKNDVIDALCDKSGIIKFGKAGEIEIPCSKLLGRKNVTTLKNALTNTSDADSFDATIRDMLPNIDDVLSKYGVGRGSIWNKIFKGAFSKKGSSFPTAEQMEMVIAYAYNKNYDKEEYEDDEANLSFVGVASGKSNYINYYNSNKEWIDKLINTIHNSTKVKSLTKLPKDSSKVSKEWREFGGKEATPKTDLYGDNDYRFSLKKFGGSQAMSGGMGEARATLLSVLCDIFKSNTSQVIDKNSIPLNIEIKSKLKEFVQDINDDSDDDSVKNAVDKLLFSADNNDKLYWTLHVKKSDLSDVEYKLRQKIHKELTDLISRVLDTSKQFKLAVIREALSGKIKFNNTDASATHILEWGTSGKCIIKTIDEYAHEANVDDFGIEINFKSSKGFTNTAMRIMNAKGDNELADVEDKIDKAIDNQIDSAVDSIKSKAKSNTAKKTSRRATKPDR